ncbi:MAG: DUF1905 domain-containing protein [Candidatus Paceibacterota bacterium]
MPKKKQYKVKTQVFAYPGMGGWHFASVPKKESEQIKKDFKDQARGWGSLPVEVKIGKTQWSTSIFPDKKSGTYLLPLKAQVRKAEGLFDQDKVAIEIRLV